MDDKGQISLEYLLILVISLIILIAFTLPLMDYGMGVALDVSDSLKVKSDLSDIALAVKTVYNEGQGSKQTVHVQPKDSIKVNVGQSHISASMPLHEGGYKKIKVSCKSNLESSSIYLRKGSNTIIVEWPVNSENMTIFTGF